MLKSQIWIMKKGMEKKHKRVKKVKIICMRKRIECKSIHDKKTTKTKQKKVIKKNGEERNIKKIGW